MKPVVWFAEVGRGDGSLAGGKGANLGELTRVGLPVPPGFIVTSGAYFRFFEDASLRPRIARHLDDVDPTSPQRLNLAAAKIKQLITDTPVPADIADAIVAAHGVMGGAPVAVRSSATAEDLAEASFAGQQSSYVNVTEGLIETVRECWASLFEPQAIAYRHRRHIHHLNVGIAVVVQKMVQAHRSGVMFTVHPITRDPGRIVVEAVLGLGEAAVSGAVTPDLYIVNKDGLAVEERHVDTQEKQLLSVTAEGEANAWVNIPRAQGAAQKLNDEEIRILAALACRIEAHYGAPQDIEWAEETGDFYILQTRPVTTV